MASKGERYHPMAILVWTIRGLRQYFGLFLFLFIFTSEFLVFLALPLLAFVMALVRYATTRYHIEDQRILLRRGLIEKTETEVPYQRIQTVRRRQWFFFKPFDLVQVDLDTAGQSSGSEIALLAVPMESYIRMKEAVDRAKGLSTASSGELNSGKASTKALPERLLYRMSLGDIVLTTATSQALLVGFFGVLAFLFQALPEGEELERLGESLLAAGLAIALIVAAFGVLLIFAVVFIRNILLYYDFRLSTSADGVHISRGLLERHEQTIPYEKIRGLQISENLLRRPLKKAAVEILLAGSIGDEENQAAKLHLCPLIDRSELSSLLGAALPDFPWPEDKAWRRPTRGRPFYFVRFPLLTLFAALGLVLAALLFKLPEPWPAVLVLNTAGILFFSFLWFLQALAKSRNQALTLDPYGAFALMTMRGFTRVRYFSQARNIQATRFGTTPFLERKGIHHLSIWLKTQGPFQMSLRFLPPNSTAGFPIALEELPEPFEARYRLGEGSSVHRDALALRRLVFIEEQGIDPALELDNQDERALHAVLYRGRRPLATLRFLPENPEHFRITRFAVHPDYRRQGYGARLLNDAEAHVQDFGVQRLSLHAQNTAVPFYQACGYQGHEEPFLEAGIPHCSMVKFLAPSQKDKSSSMA